MDMSEQERVNDVMMRITEAHLQRYGTPEIKLLIQPFYAITATITYADGITTLIFMWTPEGYTLEVNKHE